MSDTIVFRGVTYHLIPGLAPCFQYDMKTNTYTGYVDPKLKFDKFVELANAIDADKRSRYEAIPPNIRKLAEYIHTKRNPKLVTEALIAYLEGMCKND